LPALALFFFSDNDSENNTVNNCYSTSIDHGMESDIDNANNDDIGSNDDNDYDDDDDDNGTDDNNHIDNNNNNNENDDGDDDDDDDDDDGADNNNNNKTGKNKNKNRCAHVLGCFLLILPLFSFRSSRVGLGHTL